MRIWDLPPDLLCRQHLLGEHRELHAVWSVITKEKIGYSMHPETRRWIGKLRALFLRHQRLVKEMKKRGYVHRSNLSSHLATGNSRQDRLINTIFEQREILRKKRCQCFKLK